MLLTYIDESYTAHKYFIAALMCPEQVVNPLADDLEEVVRAASRSYAVELSSDAELHGHALFHGKEDWSLMAPLVRARIKVYESAMAAIGSHEVEIILRGVDIDKQRARYKYPAPPHEVVLQHVMERVNRSAALKNSYALLIADEIPDENDHRKNMGLYKKAGTPGYLSSQLPRLVDTIHFAPSHASRLLQAADLIVFMHRRLQTHIETDTRAEKANNRIWRHIKPRIVHEHCWVP